MKLNINYFPPITQKCSIDISKRALVFVGENNSGKTYISQLIWGIYKYCEIEYSDFLDDNLELEKIYLIDQTQLTGKAYDYTINVNNETIDLISRKFSKFVIDNVIESVFHRKLESIDIDLEFDINDFHSCYISSVFGMGNYAVGIKKEINSLEIKCRLESKTSFEHTENDLNFEDFICCSTNYLESLIAHKMLGINDTTFMPASRLFLAQYYKIIREVEITQKNRLVKNISDFNQENKYLFESPYTEPTNELINALTFRLNSDNIKDNEYYNLIAKLIGGEIRVIKDETVSMADFAFKPNNLDHELPMHLSSSMVNQLSIIYLYFKYLHKKNDFLLIDEPEMNLHPDASLRFLEILLQFASTNKLLIATHSTTYAKFFENYIMLEGQSKKLINDDPENIFIWYKNINLEIKDIGIYYFNGNTVVRYNKNDDKSMHFHTFSKLESQLEKQNTKLINELFGE